MQEHEHRSTAIHQRVPVLLAIIGVLCGLLLGVVAILVMRNTSTLAAPDATKIDAPALAQRWYIWDGSAPLAGEPFQSEKDCESARRQFVADGEAAAQDMIRRLPPMTVEQIATLGNPADRIEGNLAMIRRAYCRMQT